MALESSAFCPGHVTAFFEPVDHPDPFKRGSRGAGLCLSLGVKTRVKARLGRKQNVRVYLNRQEVPAPTTKLAVERAIGGAAFEVIVQSEVQLPISQGFGMSAAGALSAALAVNEALDLGMSHTRVVAIAHAIRHGDGAEAAWRAAVSWAERAGAALLVRFVAIPTGDPQPVPGRYRAAVKLAAVPLDCPQTASATPAPFTARRGAVASPPSSASSSSGPDQPEPTA